MIFVVVFLAASAVLGGIASYQSREPIAPQLQYRPGTPTQVVERCRQAVIEAAREHAAEKGATLLRVDATSAGDMRPIGTGHVAPVEIGVVYARPSGQELRQGVIECHVDEQERAVLASLPGAAR